MPICPVGCYKITCPLSLMAHRYCPRQEVPAAGGDITLSTVLQWYSPVDRFAHYGHVPRRVFPRPTPPRLRPAVVSVTTGYELVEAAVMEASSAVIEYALPNETVEVAPVITTTTAAAAINNTTTVAVEVLGSVNNDAADASGSNADVFASDDVYVSRRSLVLFGSDDNDVDDDVDDDDDDDNDDDENNNLASDTPTRSSRGAALVRPSLGAAFESDDDDGFDLFWPRAYLAPPVVALTPADAFAAKQEAGLVPFVKFVPFGHGAARRMRPAMVALVNAMLEAIDEDNVTVASVIDLDDDQEEDEDEDAFDWSWSTDDEEAVSLWSQADDDDDEIVLDWSLTVDVKEVELLAATTVVVPVTKVRKSRRAARFGRRRPATVARKVFMLENVEEEEEEEDDELEAEKPCVEVAGSESDELTTVVKGLIASKSDLFVAVVAGASEVAAADVGSTVVVQELEVEASVSEQASSVASLTLKRKAKAMFQALSVCKARSPSPSEALFELVPLSSLVKDEDDSAESFGRWCAVAAAAAANEVTLAPLARQSSSTPSFRSVSSGSATSTASSNSSDDRALRTPPPPSMNGSVGCLVLDDAASRSTLALSTEGLVSGSDLSIGQCPSTLATLSGAPFARAARSRPSLAGSARSCAAEGLVRLIDRFLSVGCHA